MIKLIPIDAYDDNNIIRFYINPKYISSLSEIRTDVNKIQYAILTMNNSDTFPVNMDTYSRLISHFV